jgi:hypothetical protein
MYVAEHESSDSFIPPESRTDFYQRVTNELLIRRRLQQTGLTPAYSTLRDQRQRILGQLALAHLLDPNQPANCLKWNIALEVVRAITHCTQEEASTIFRELSRETGLISEERYEETFRFIHLTFCEFMAAFEAVRGDTDRWKDIFTLHNSYCTGSEAALRTRLLEVIPFAAALRTPRGFQNESIADVAKFGDFRLLARTFLETKLYDHSAWGEFISAQRAKLLSTPEAGWNDEWLRDLHLFNVVVRDAAAAAKHVKQSLNIDLGAFFQALLDTQQTSLERILHAYAVQDAAAAFYLCEASGMDMASRFPQLVIHSCDQAPFFGLVFEKAIQYPQGEWLTLLAEAALASPIVARWLMEAQAPSAWSALIEKVRKQDQWFASGIVERNFLTECLTVALMQPVGDASNLSLIGRLRVFPFPRKVAPLRAASIVLSLAPFAILALFQFLYFYSRMNYEPARFAIYELIGFADTGIWIGAIMFYALFIIGLFVGRYFCWL